MHKIYLFIEKNNYFRKVAVDQAYLYKHKRIRLLKEYFEEGLFLLHVPDSNKIERYDITKNKIVKEDDYHYFFNFPFKYEDVEGKEPEISG